MEAAVSDMFGVAQKALDKMCRAAKRGTGCRLTPREIAVLDKTVVGDLWNQPAPKDDLDPEPYVMECPREPISRDPQDHVRYRLMREQYDKFAQQQNERWKQWAIRNGKMKKRQK
jgi:hypothetical protein